MCNKKCLACQLAAGAPEAQQPVFSHTESVNPSHLSTLPHEKQAMQRFLIALYLGAASAFAPPQSTASSLVRLHANPIDIYSTAAARNYDFACSWQRQQLDYVALPIVELLEPPDIKDSDPT